MKLYKTGEGIVIEKENGFCLLQHEYWNTFVNDDALFQKMKEKTRNLSPSSNHLPENIFAPVGSRQELWACGVRI